MADEASHVALANRNHRTLAALCPDPALHAEWIATIAFYKAVQIVEAVFHAQARRHSCSHEARIADLKSSQYAEIFKAFRPLFAASQVARYLVDNSARKFGDPRPRAAGFRSFADYLPPADVVERLVRRRLDVLEQHAVRFLSESQREALDRACHLLANLTAMPGPPAST